MARPLLALLLALAPSVAGAQTIGLFAPSAPFSGPVARLDFVAGLASHIAARVGGEWRGKAFARAADFTAAARRGELDYAVVDSAYLAAIGAPYTVLASAQRDGATSGAWQVVGSAAVAGDIDALRGRTVAAADIGARSEPFVYDVLLEGEVARGSFGRLQLAPDALSALAAVERGRADAAVVPSALALPPGSHRLVSLRSVPWPVLVALRGAGAARPGDGAVAQAAQTYDGKVFNGFVAGGGDAVRSLAGRFAGVDRRAPLVVPEPRLAAASLLAGRELKVPRSDPRTLLIVPANPGNPAKPPAIGR